MTRHRERNLINTPLKRGGGALLWEVNRLSGFPPFGRGVAAQETAKAVQNFLALQLTPLKRGVNKRGASS
jgi:hypothetical protein